MASRRVVWQFFFGLSCLDGGVVSASGFQRLWIQARAGRIELELKQGEFLCALYILYLQFGQVYINLRKASYLDIRMNHQRMQFIIKNKKVVRTF